VPVRHKTHTRTQTDRQTDRQTRLKIRALQVCNRANIITILRCKDNQAVPPTTMDVAIQQRCRRAIQSCHVNLLYTNVNSKLLSRTGRDMHCVNSQLLSDLTWVIKSLITPPAHVRRLPVAHCVLPVTATIFVVQPSLLFNKIENNRGTARRFGLT